MPATQVATPAAGPRPPNGSSTVTPAVCSGRFRLRPLARRETSRRSLVLLPAGTTDQGVSCAALYAPSLVAVMRASAPAPKPAPRWRLQRSCAVARFHSASTGPPVQDTGSRWSTVGERGSPWTYRCEVSPPQTWHVHLSRAWMCLRTYGGKAVRLLPCALSRARERDLSFALLQSMLQNEAPGPAGGDPHQPHMLSGSMVSPHPVGDQTRSPKFL